MLLADSKKMGKRAETNVALVQFSVFRVTIASLF